MLAGKLHGTNQLGDLSLICRDEKQHGRLKNSLVTNDTNTTHSLCTTIGG